MFDYSMWEITAANIEARFFEYSIKEYNDALGLPSRDEDEGEYIHAVLPLLDLVNHDWLPGI